MDLELWIFIVTGCLFSCCVGSAVTYYAVNWSRDRQEEEDQARRENAIEHGLKLAQENQQLEQRVSGEHDEIEDEPFMADSQRCVWCHQPRHDSMCNRDDLPDYVTPEYVAEVDRIKATANCPEAGGCRRPEQCETGCHWRRLDALNRPLADDDPASTLPRSLPGRER